jgi:hypothetical protein
VRPFRSQRHGLLIAASPICAERSVLRFRGPVLPGRACIVFISVLAIFNILKIKAA